MVNGAEFTKGFDARIGIEQSDFRLDDSVRFIELDLPQLVDQVVYDTTRQDTGSDLLLQTNVDTAVKQPLPHHLQQILHRLLCKLMFFRLSDEDRSLGQFAEVFQAQFVGMCQRLNIFGFRHQHFCVRDPR